MIYYGTDNCELYTSEYAQFKTFGYDSIVELLQKIAIFDRSSIKYRDASGIIGKIYAQFLMRPYDIALDGLSLTRTVDRDLFLKVRGISRVLHLQSRSDPMPSQSLVSRDIDVGKYLIDSCEIHLPNDLHTILKIESEPFQKAYNSLNDAVEQKQKKNIEDRSLALCEAIRESNEIIDSMKIQSNTYKNVITYSSVSAAIIGPIAAYITGNPMFEVLSGLEAVSHFAAPIADKLVKINKPDHIVFIHDTQKLKLPNELRF